jgi:benzoyl-CoA reductase/2-hydroxyglutaryl-CoA dehydratase subunit BcrC/BadD/HgdB
MKGKQNLFVTIADKLATLKDQAAVTNPDQEVVYGAQVDYFRRAAEAMDRGKPIAWLNFGPAPELFWAMDIVPIYVEGTMRTLTLSSSEDICRYIDLAEQHIPDFVCSADKAVFGAALAGDIPLPAMIVHSSHPCDSALATFPPLAEYLGVPHFCIDMPYWSDERTYRYVENELWQLIAFLEETTKAKLDLDRLKQVAKYSSMGHEYILKYNELRQAVPCPLSGKDLLADRSTFRRMAGTPELVDYAKKRYELAKQRVNDKIGSIAEEKIRLIWVFAMPTDPLLYDWLEVEYGAVSIMEMMSNFGIAPIEDPSDISSIFRGLAGKTMNMPMGKECRGPWEYFGDTAVRMCRDYGPDAAIYAGHVACKNAWGISKLIKDRIEDELDLPCLLFEVDIFDPRITSLEAMKARLADFFENAY